MSVICWIFKKRKEEEEGHCRQGTGKGVGKSLTLWGAKGTVWLEQSVRKHLRGGQKGVRGPDQERICVKSERVSALS